LGVHVLNRRRRRHVNTQSAPFIATAITKKEQVGQRTTPELNLVAGCCGDGVEAAIAPAHGNGFASPPTLETSRRWFFLAKLRNAGWD